jgi:phage/plasmid-like protein (TIGR03299 family)
MAHELELDEQGNKKMFYIGDHPWWGVGNQLQSPPTIAEGIIQAGLNWDVKLLDLHTDEGDMVTHHAVKRVTDGKILGVVGPAYTPLQNTEAFEFFNPFLEAGLAELHTAGSLKGGSVIWVLAKIISDPMVIQKDDTVDKYILLSNSHDGTLSVRAGYTFRRVVCNNTLTMAHNSESSKLIRIKHTSNIVMNIERLRETMDVINMEFNATAEQYRFLASQPINSEDLEKYIQVVFDLGKKTIVDKDNPDENEAVKSRVLDGVLNTFETGRGMSVTPNTYWKAYNACNEFQMYTRGREADTRLHSLWFGTASRIDKHALTTAIKMATV